MNNASDNLCRWDGRSGSHYEVWFLTMNHRATRRGFWFRYTIEASADPEESEAKAAIWAVAFDRSNPNQNFGLRCEHPIDSFAAKGPDNFSLKIGDNLLTEALARGSVDADGHSLRWELNFNPNSTTYHHLTSSLLRWARPSSFVCSPNLDTRFSGIVVVDGHETAIEDEPGCQSHLWGKKHVDDWVWVHSNAFDGHPGTVFEGLAARPRRAGQTLPPIQSLMLRHRGEEHRFVRLRFAEQWERKLGIGYWSFSAANTRISIDGIAQCRLRDMLQVEYRDPDGEPLYCINSEVANLKIRLFRRIHGLRWRHIETVHAYSTAHLEHASRETDPHVRSAFQPNSLRS
jgi:tocopherol cyclase-like protein